MNCQGQGEKSKYGSRNARYKKQEEDHTRWALPQICDPIMHVTALQHPNFEQALNRENRILAADAV